MKRLIEIRDFSHRNGWTKDKVIIGTANSDNPRLLDRTRIRHKWLTHNRQTYREGSVIFANGLRLCLATWRINKKPVRVFVDDEYADVVWRKQRALERIESWAKSAKSRDLKAGAEILAAAGGLTPTLSVIYRPWLERSVATFAEAASLENLEAFVSLVAMPDLAPSGPAVAA